MSDDGVSLHVEAFFFLFHLHLCFFVNSVQKMCTSAPYRITMKTWSTSVNVHLYLFSQSCFSFVVGQATTECMSCDIISD